MKTRTKVFIGLTVWFAFALILFADLLARRRQERDLPAAERVQLDPWIELKLGPIDMSINKAVMYLFIAAALTTGHADLDRAPDDHPPEQGPGRDRVGLRRDPQEPGRAEHGRDDGEEVVRLHRDPLLLHLVLEHDRYIPLPTNTEHTVRRVRLELPAFAIYAATANISIPLVLTPGGVDRLPRGGYPGEGLHRLHEELHPAGHGRPRRGPAVLHRGDLGLRRIISLSRAAVRQHPRRPPADPVHGRRLVVLLGLSAVGVFTLGMAIPFFLFEVGLVATLQAFIFAILTSIYLGGATAEGH